MKMKTKILALCGSVAAVASFSSAANAHLVGFGYKDLGNGGVQLFGEHWHGDLSAPYTANGGIHIQKLDSNGNGVGPVILASWTGVINNKTIAQMNLTGYQADTHNGGAGTYQDWMSTSTIALGNGTYSFYTGPNCCIDPMGSPVKVTVSGVTSVAPGTLQPTPGAVPEPATWAMMIGGFGMVGGAMRSARRRTKTTVSFA